MKTYLRTETKSDEVVQIHMELQGNFRLLYGNVNISEKLTDFVSESGVRVCSFWSIALYAHHFSHKNLSSKIH